MDPVIKTLFSAMDKKAKEDKERESYRRESDLRFEALKRSEMAFRRGSGVRTATAADYAKWLVGYIRKGNKPTHTYDYRLEGTGVKIVGGNSMSGFQTEPAESSWLYVESGSHTLPDLYGATSLNVVVSAEATVKVGSRGHNCVYYMKDYRVSGRIVPTYTDVIKVITDTL